LKIVHMSIATYSTWFFHCCPQASSQAPVPAAVRPSICPSRPWPFDRSTNPTCQRSALVRQVPRAWSKTLRLAPADLVDPEHPDRIGPGGQHLLGVGGERGHHHGPGERVVPRGLDDRSTAVGHRRPGRLA
jgi:hypothetical protein